MAFTLLTCEFKMVRNKPSICNLTKRNGFKKPNPLHVEEKNPNNCRPMPVATASAQSACCRDIFGSFPMELTSFSTLTGGTFSLVLPKDYKPSQEALLIRLPPTIVPEEMPTDVRKYPHREHTCSQIACFLTNASHRQEMC